MAARKPKPLTLGPESWGQRLRRGYYVSKDAYGHTWSELAERISQVQPITDTALMSLMRQHEKPQRIKALHTSWLLCIAMGLDPAELGLNASDLNSGFLASKEVADLLRPRSPCFSITAA